ncbi:MAG: hypothetical protein II917_01550 [Synergistaceae bacterium]|nr:hypothetical protein [Synergistaceae bacterium]
MTRKFWFTLILFIVVTACASYGLSKRVRLERDNQSIAIIADYREVAGLAKNSGLEIDEALRILTANGMRGLMVSELTGDNITHGVGQAELKEAKFPERGIEGTIITIMPSSPYKDLLNEWLRVRFAVNDSDNRTGALFVPMSFNVLKTAGIIPDIDGLVAARRNNLPIYYRPAPSPGHLSERASIMLKRVHDKYDVAVFTPAGEIVSGYPDVSIMARTAHELKLPLALVEFSKQLGEPALNRLASPLLIPLHSVTNEEMSARRITRAALRDRLVRAAVERSVRLLLLRTAPPTSAEFVFADFANEVKILADELTSRGFEMAMPGAVFADGNLNTNIFAAVALSIMLAFSLCAYLVRMGMTPDSKIGALFVAGCVVLSVLVWKVGFIARLAGALTAPLIAVEASLIAMDSGKNKNILYSFIFAVVGGLSLASFFSVTSYMLRLQTFSGVKFTLILPPVMVLLHDLKNRIHPESLIEFLSRPPLWGELVMIGVLLAGVGLIIFRSGNVTFIPGFEARIRETLERLLIARPRTREVFVGYPSLLLLNFLVSRNLFAHYRELFRIGVALGFSSVINSFCHFHTPLMMILLREFNGLWTGLLVGIIAVLLVRLVVIPCLKLIRPLIS